MTEPTLPTVACPACGTPVPAAESRCPSCGRAVSADATRREDRTDHQPLPAVAPTVTHDAPDPNAATATAGGAAAAPGPAVAADAIPGYEIHSELGRGGMGVVYQARELSLNRTVALKVLLAGAHGGPAALARFKTEAEAAAAVQHRHIVHVFAVGEHRGLPFLAMELAPGGSLAARLEEGPLAPAEAARVVEAIARGVQAAHARGILHRDLKPANVLFTADGEPKLADFGLAKVGDSGLTATGAVMGTPAYMAPEQARGDTKAIGPATDVWALGAVLSECLTGRPPFRGRSAPETFRLVCEADPDPLPGVPRDLRTIALKCLEKDPAKRYPSAAAVADDLRRWQAGEPIAARPHGPTVHVARWVGRHRGPVYLATGVLLAAVVTVVVLSLRSKPVPPPGPGPEVPVAKLPPDLALVPADSVAFLSARPGDLRRPELARLINRMAGAVGPGAPDQVQADHIVEQAIGIPPADIERGTVVLRTEPGRLREGRPDFLVVVRTARPVDIKPVRDRLAELFGTLAPHDRAGHRYYAAKAKEFQLALFKAGDHELAFGTTTEIEAMIDRLGSPPADGPLTPALEEAARGHALVLAARSPAELLGTTLPVPAGHAPPEVGRALEQLQAAETVVALVDLLPPAPDRTLPGADAEVRIRFPSAARAAEAVSAFRGVLDWLGEPDPDRSTGPDSLLPGLRTAAHETRLRQDGPDVIATGGPRWTAADWAGLDKKRVLTTEGKLRLIGLALENYADTNGHYPPAVVRSPDGKPLYSWRVELLPFLEMDNIYRKMNRNEPWDHPDNKALLERVPEIFAMTETDPSRSVTGTRFQVLRGKGGAFEEGAKITRSHLTDGSGNTVTVVEAGDPVTWAAPRDITYQPGDPLPKLGLPGTDTVLVLLADGAPKRLFRAALRPEDLAALFTRAGNDRVDWGRLEVRKRGR